MTSISIVGCGWFGLPLAKQLIAEGYRIKGSKRTELAAEQLSEHGIEGYKLALPSDTPIPESLFNSDILILNLPPGLRRGSSTFLSQLDQIFATVKAHTYQQVIFISSSGVYSDQGENINEQATIGTSTKAKTLYEAEQLVTANIQASKTTIFRFAGLVGGSRHPGRFLAGKKDLTGGNQVVNLVHLQDIIAVTALAIKHPDSAGIFNVCSPVHIPRELFYAQAANSLKLTAPTFTTETKPQRIINGQYVCERLGFHYQYDSIEKLLTNN